MRILLVHSLLHFLWQGAALAALLWVLLRFLERPTARYNACAAALAMMALAPVATAFWLAQSSIVTLTGRNGALALADLPRTAAANPSWLEANATWLSGAWLVGALLLLLRSCLLWWNARRWTFRSLAPLPAPLDAGARALAVRFSARNVRFGASAHAASAYVFGWLRPVIVLPLAALGRLTEAEIEALLAHELAHVVRRDFLVNLLQTLAECVLFYHPAVWWVSAKMREERELCCDDYAVAVCRDEVLYSNALLTLEELRMQLPLRQSVLAATGGRLGQRIRRLLDAPSAPVAATRFSLAPIILAAALLTLSLALVAQDAPPPPPAPPAPAAAPAAPTAPGTRAVAPVPPAAPSGDVAPAVAPEPPVPPAPAGSPDLAPPPPPAPPAHATGSADNPQARKQMEALRKQLDEARMHADRARQAAAQDRGMAASARVALDQELQKLMKQLESDTTHRITAEQQKQLRELELKLSIIAKAEADQARREARQAQKESSIASRQAALADMQAHAANLAERLNSARQLADSADLAGGVGDPNALKALAEQRAQIERQLQALTKQLGVDAKVELGSKTTGDLAHQEAELMAAQRALARATWMMDSKAGSAEWLKSGAALGALGDRSDATPSKQELDRRTKFATEHFGGVNTDRGRIYVQFGPPDEIESHPGKSEVWHYKSADKQRVVIEIEFDGSGKKIRMNVNS